MNDREKLRELEKAATKGPYYVQRVDREEGHIDYEVCTKNHEFHVIFSEMDHLDIGMSAKNQAEFYAAARNALPELLDKLDARDKAINTLYETLASKEARIAELENRCIICPDCKSTVKVPKEKEIKDGEQ